MYDVKSNIHFTRNVNRGLMEFRTKLNSNANIPYFTKHFRSKIANNTTELTTQPTPQEQQQQQHYINKCKSTL